MTEGTNLTKFIYRISIALGVFLINALIFGVLAEYLCYLIFETRINEVLNLPEGAKISQNHINALRFFQGFVSFGTFILSSFVISYSFKQQPSEYLGLTQFPKGKNLLLIPLVFAAFIPLMSGLIEFNSGLNLPQSMHGMQEYFKNLELKSDRIYKMLLTMNTTGDLFANLLVMALIPALGEELFCRGVLLNIVFDYTGKFLKSVFIVALIFTSLHLQFFKIIPMLSIAIILGLWIRWTGGIWASILFHLLNNCMVILGTYYYNRGVINYFTNEQASNPLWLILLSFLITAFFFFYLNRINQPKPLTTDE